MKSCACFAGMLMMMLMTLFAQNTQADAVWDSSPEGETLLRSFANAPFPHVSREKGYTYDKTFFDAPAHYQDSTVGIFIPAGYRPSETVDYVVHFHGWSNHVSNVLDQYALRRQLVESGRNAILLVPQGPKDAQDSSGGRLESDAGAFAALLQEVTAFLQQEGKIHTAHIGKIVLTAHSGGYRVVGGILTRGGLTEHITDVLLFDASYGELEAYTKWATQGHARRLLSIFTRHLAPENFMLLTLLQQHRAHVTSLLEPDLKESLLQQRQPILIHTLDLPHDEVLQKRDYFALFLRTSALPAIAK